MGSRHFCKENAKPQRNAVAPLVTRAHLYTVNGAVRSAEGVGTLRLRWGAALPKPLADLPKRNIFCGKYCVQTSAKLSRLPLVVGFNKQTRCCSFYSAIILTLFVAAVLKSLIAAFVFRSSNFVYPSTPTIAYFLCIVIHWHDVMHSRYPAVNLACILQLGVMPLCIAGQ